MLCPICKKNQCYYSKSKVKKGETIKTVRGYYFKQTGWRDKIDEWWSCKKCADTMLVNDYTDAMIKYYNDEEIEQEEIEQDEISQQYQSMFKLNPLTSF